MNDDLVLLAGGNDSSAAEYLLHAQANPATAPFYVGEEICGGVVNVTNQVRSATRSLKASA